MINIALAFINNYGSPDNMYDFAEALVFSLNGFINWRLCFFLHLRIFCISIHACDSVLLRLTNGTPVSVRHSTTKQNSVFAHRIIS